ncbi:MAG: sulfatase [Armatimonadetes bacterium]|nr:sulfatase [Armatimonadota bacterium]
MRSLKIAALAAILTVGGATQPGAAAPAHSKAAAKPNIVLIVADDLGYGELGCYGGKEVPTPNIDSLAKDGVRLTDGYVSCPVCAPTRAGLMTGRYGPRFGFELNPGPQQNASSGFGLPKSEKTLAERLKAEGYATGMVGKWHLGYKDGLTPPDRGFDSFFGFLGGAHNYRRSGQGGAILRGKEKTTGAAYLTYAFGREAVGFIEANKRHPFFLYLPFNAVHAPLQAPTRLAEKTASFPEGKRRTFAGMLMAMDEAVGQVLATLRKSGLDENTLVIFISDNGGPTPQTTSSNGPLRGFKGQTWEGGIRVPMLVRWKEKLPAGKEFREPVIALDIVPTVLGAAGKPISADEKLDGVNLLPFLTGGDKGAPHDLLYWRFGQQYALREGDWKLVTAQGTTDALFDLAKDIAEKNNLAADEPTRVRAMKAKWEAWSKTLMAPKWGRNSGKVED